MRCRDGAQALTPEGVTQADTNNPVTANVTADSGLAPSPAAKSGGGSSLPGWAKVGGASNDCCIYSSRQCAGHT